ncbi:MAG: type 1 glutamine amidotransferase domain-containing protein [Hyphomonas sp.]|uniref:type 1 glutamine amidotransferase domain-containing protein n=1 Tax=Hyphomonas sp. TaxID=87 RepID=UPI003527F1D9
MKKLIVYGVMGLVSIILIVWLGLPILLTRFGLHPHYRTPEMHLEGRKALIVVTSHDKLGESGKATGVFASEMTAPYYAFLDSGMNVEIASIQGGPVPIEPVSVRWPIASRPDRRFLRDSVFQSKVANSSKIGLVDMSAYDIVFLAGGWGAAYDFAQSDELGDQISAAYANGSVLGGVCHGPLGLLNARDTDGSALVAGRHLTAVTDKQIAELGIQFTPKHPERDLRAAGALFESESAFRDFFANHVVVDGTLVTGQNQNSGTETAVEMMKQLMASSNREDS